jgi:hypothetical protein
MEEDIGNEPNDLALNFFKFGSDSSVITDHQEWLLREYSKLLHRECCIKKREDEQQKKIKNNSK